MWAMPILFNSDQPFGVQSILNQQDQHVRQARVMLVHFSAKTKLTTTLFLININECEEDDISSVR